jgi:hypothetical protein
MVPRDQSDPVEVLVKVPSVTGVAPKVYRMHQNNCAVYTFVPPHVPTELKFTVIGVPVVVVTQ